LEIWAPSAAADDPFRRWWATYLRLSASPGAALAIMQMNFGIDARHILPAVRVPTLIMHRAGDRLTNVSQGRYLAEHIAGAQYVELPGEDHVPWVGDVDTIADEVEEFLTGVRHGAEPD
jgi:pimeloyl-ACP methyl ester carboxylesterase